jgi:hypothetical protein
MAARRGALLPHTHDRANNPRHDRSELGSGDATAGAKGTTNPQPRAPLLQRRPSHWDAGRFDLGGSLLEGLAHRLR